MPSPFKVDSIRVNPSESGVRSISSVEGDLLFKDATVTEGLILSQLANLSTITNVKIVGKVGYGCQYNTIQDALDAIPTSSSEEEPYLILILPGIYAEDLVITKDGLCLFGLGDVTIQSAYDATPDVPQAEDTILILAGEGTVPNYVCFQNIIIKNSHNTKSCVKIEGGAASDVGSSGIYFKNCDFRAVADSGNFTVNAESVNHLFFKDSFLSSSTKDLLSFKEVASFHIRDITNIGAVYIRWDEEEALPSATPTQYIFSGCSSLGKQTDNVPFQASILNGPSLSFHCCSCSTIELSGTGVMDASFSSFEDITVNDDFVLNLDHCSRGDVNTNNQAQLNESMTKGVVEFDNENFKPVTFPIAKGNTDYFISLTPINNTGGDIPYITSVTTEGFDINFSENQTVSVRWFVYE